MNTRGDEDRDPGESRPISRRESQEEIMRQISRTEAQRLMMECGINSETPKGREDHRRLLEDVRTFFRAMDGAEDWRKTLMWATNFRITTERRAAQMSVGTYTAIAGFILSLFVAVTAWFRAGGHG